MSSQSLSALLALVLAAAACEPDTVTFTTPLIFAAPAGDIDASRCLRGAGVDTFVVDLVAYDGDPRPEAGLSPCVRCASGAATCRLLARSCRCSGRRTDLQAIGDAISGVEVEVRDPSLRLCVRVMLLDRGDTTGSVEGPAVECGAGTPECAPTGPLPADELRVCSVSDLGAVNESGAPLVVRTFYCDGEGLAMCAVQWP